MKKIFMLFAALAAFTACSNDDIAGDKSTDTNMSTVTFHATMEGDEGDAESRASIAINQTTGNPTSVVWDEGDEISVLSWVYPKKYNNKCTLSSGAGSKQGSFTGTCQTGTNIYAVYPYSADNSTGANPRNEAIRDFYIDWNGINQTAVLESSPLNTPMVAYTPNVTEGATTIPLSFQNVCALVKVTTDYACKQIVLSAKGSEEYLAAKEIRVEYDENQKPRICDTSGAKSNTVTLTSKDGANMEAGTYYIAVMPGTLASGFDLTFTNIYGEKTWTKSTSKSVTFKRGTVLNLGTIAIKSEMVKMAGSGTAADPYIIHDFDQLQHMRDFVNTSTGGGDCYKQVADIDGGGAEFTPIGAINNSESHCFGGTYDGGGHTIRNIKVGTNYTNNDYVSNYYITAPFAYVSDATIKNLTIENIDITGISGTTNNPNYIKSSLIGVAFGSDNSGSSTTVENVTVTGVHNNIAGFTKGNEFTFGGIIALARSHLNITNCANHTSFIGNIPTSDLRWGGIIGAAYAVRRPLKTNEKTDAHININKCRNYGNIPDDGKNIHAYVGGILGYGYDGSGFLDDDIITIINNCVNFGNLQSSSKADCFAGGIVGKMDSDGFNDEYPHINNCINNGSISISSESTTLNDACAGGIVGDCYDDDTQIKYCANIGAISSNDLKGSIAGHDHGTLSHCYNYYSGCTTAGGGKNEGNVGNGTALADCIEWMNKHKDTGLCTWKYADSDNTKLDLDF